MYKVEVKLIFIYCYYKKRICKENCVKGNAIYNFYGQKFTMCVLGIERRQQVSFQIWKKFKSVKDKDRSRDLILNH